MIYYHREAGIWTPVNESKDDPVPTYNYNDNGLTYVSTIFHACIHVRGTYTYSCITVREIIVEAPDTLGAS